MSVLVRGMKMPKSGIYVLSVGNNDENETVFTIATQTNSGKIIPCYSGVAISIPPHVRLIDADELEVCDGWLREAEEYSTHITFVYSNDIDNAPTVVPAEEAQE